MKKKYLTYQFFIHIFLTLIQILIYFGNDIYAIYQNWYSILIQILLSLCVLFLVFACCFLYKLIITNKINFLCLILQCIGVSISALLYCEFLYEVTMLNIICRFIFTPYLFFTGISIIIFIISKANKRKATTK